MAKAIAGISMPIDCANDTAWFRKQIALCEETLEEVDHDLDHQASQAEARNALRTLIAAYRNAIGELENTTVKRP